MEALFDALLYIVIIGGMVFIIGGLIHGIYRLTVKIRYINIRTIWQIHRKHSHV